MPIREGCIFEGNCKIADDLDTGYYVIFRSCEIGSGVGIWSHSVVDPGVVIGDNVRIQAHVYISSGTIIDDAVFVGPGTIFLNDKYPPRYDKGDWQPPVIRRGAVIGGGVVVCPGVEIGEGAMVGAGAVVTRNVPPKEVWVGSPAREFDPNRRKLMVALGADNTGRFRLELSEAVGYLVLMIHRLRGLLDVAGKHLQLSDVDLDNWQSVIASVAAYEEFTWDVVSPRAMLSQLRAFRKAGYLDEHFEKLLDHDSHGRMGEGQERVPDDLRQLVLDLNKIAREGDG